MKVLWLANIPSPYRVDFLNELGKSCDLTVLFEKKFSQERNRSWIPNKFANFKGIILNGINTGVDNAFCLSVTKWLKKNKYDFIVVSNYSTPTGIITIECLKMRKIPFIIEVDGGFPKKGKGLKEKLKKHLIGSATYWLSSSGMTDDYLVAYGAKKENIFRYPFTSLKVEDISSERITKDIKRKLRKKLGVKGEKIAISVGQFIYRKGFDTLIEAWKDVNPQFCLFIIGDGEKESEYKTVIKEFDLKNVALVEFKSKVELAEYYKMADLFVLPTREDIWGLVISEAMAYGLPVITTDKCIAGIELIEDYQNGFIVPVDNRELLSQKMNLLLSNTELMQKTSDNNIRKIEPYTIENMAKVHLNILKTIGESK